MKIPGLRRPVTPTDRLSITLLAVVLPVLASILTDRAPFLHKLPFALHVFIIIFVAIVGGMGPALIAVLFSVLSSYKLLLNVHEPYWVTTMRCVVLLIVGVFVSFVSGSRRRALVALQERTDELILSQQGSRSASWRYTTRDNFRWQRGGFEVFGISFDDLEELPSPLTLIHPDDQPNVRAALTDMITTQGPLHIEYRVLFPNGDIHWSEARGTPIAGKPGVWRGVTFDITERKLAENALLRSEKLAAMGRLASTVAHEINNPLEAVTNLLYLARTDESQTPDTQAYLATAEAELARLADITRLTLGFVRNSAGAIDLDPTTIIEEVLSIFRHRFDLKKIDIQRSFEPNILIHIAAHELRQILTNLISNAADAVPETNPKISIHLHREAASSILLVDDNGSGITDADIRRIFEPFFSTKEDVGTGIGLWVTRELVEKNAGTISVINTGLPPTIHTRFRIAFPTVS